MRYIPDHATFRVKVYKLLWEDKPGICLHLTLIRIPLTYVYYSLQHEYQEIPWNIAFLLMCLIQGYKSFLYFKNTLEKRSRH